MENILLIIADFSLRQLYHELLFSEYCEVVPVAKVANAIVIESLFDFRTVVLYPDDVAPTEIDAFLRLQRKIKRFARARIVLLTSDHDLYARRLNATDTILDINELGPSEVIKRIKRHR